MSSLLLSSWQSRLGARFGSVGGAECVTAYGDVRVEYDRIVRTAGLLDLSFRSRLCLIGQDRQRFLHGQVTNSVQNLQPGHGCYAALVTAKAKMVSDLNIFVLADEILLDCEPGLAEIVGERLRQYIIADDVDVVDVSKEYGLLSVQGPEAAHVVGRAIGRDDLPRQLMSFVNLPHPEWGEIYLMNVDRARSGGFDLFVPTEGLERAADRLLHETRIVGGGLSGWEAMEIARVEGGIPRFGADMDAANLAPECGMDERAISYSKGCYIGQEVIARIRTYGQVSKRLHGLRLSDDLTELPSKGAPLLRGGKEVGYITSSVHSPAVGGPIALGYLRREVQSDAADLVLRDSDRETQVRAVQLPFRRPGKIGP